MTKKVKVEPRVGLNVPHPETGAKIVGSIELERTPQVIRMIKQGDLILCKNVKPKKASENTKKEAK